MNAYVKINQTLPSGLLATVTQAADPALMASYASLDKQSREQLRVAARKMLAMLDKSETWRPHFLSSAVAIPVSTQAHADLVLKHLHKHGCAQYVHDTASTPIAVIFVTKDGRLSFLFQGEARNVADYLSNKEHGHKIVDADKVLAAKSIAEIDALEAIA